MNIDKLTIDFSGLNSEKLLASWSFLIKGNFKPVLMTLFGDLFLSDNNQNVYFLDLVSGNFEMVAPNIEEFNELLSKDEQTDEWFMPRLVDEIKDKKGKLGPGQCYGYNIPPFLNGEFDLKNIVIEDRKRSLFQGSLLPVFSHVLSPLKRCTRRRIRLLAGCLNR